MSIENSREIIKRLEENIALEHAAIVQYLHHAYALGEGAIACQIEGIAREEMRHYQWFSEAVVELGGDPTLHRAPMHLEAPTAPELLRLDVADEEAAIAKYQRDAEAIEAQDIKKLLARIIADEESHRGDFVQMSQEAEGMPIRGSAAAKPASTAEEKTLEALDLDIRREYTTILQYLHQSFITPHCQVSRELEDSAQEEMKHLGWLSERVAELGRRPPIERQEPHLTTDTAEMLSVDLQRERETEALYGQQIKAVEDTEVKALLSRIKLHEVYHQDEFSELLAEVKEAAEGPKGELTVGSLVGQKQD